MRLPIRNIPAQLSVLELVKHLSLLFKFFQTYAQLPHIYYLLLQSLLFYDAFDLLL